MSTKIYNGIKFKSNNIVEIVQQLQNVREELLKICNTSDIISQEDIIGFIKYCDLDKEITKFSVYEIHHKMYDELLKQTEETRLFLRFTCSIYIIPYKDGNIYGGLFCDNVKYYKYIMPYTEDYHYQDQTDRPEEITEEEWGERDDIWNEIFEKFWTFSEVGLKYEIIGAKDLRLHERIEHALNEIKSENEPINNKDNKNETI